ncbi:MAG: hypothetical protein A3G77_17795 [Acidobacteria bacterium RIFCSPLOWO2_12_FULL_68_19]|nr:MAG: hypothetical protein A3G77_17795 [Acidobacteria bacterium RIFCSPLOWO2_12_FULL_68_19]
MVAAAAATLGGAACSQGSLPGSPTPILVGGGGGRYGGTLSYRRIGGGFSIDESAQSLSMSLVLSAADQFAAQFETSGGSRGSLQGTIDGALNAGTFTATMLVSTPAETPGAAGGLGGSVFGPRALVTCEGRGEATGRFSGIAVTWTIDSIRYDNCIGLVASSEAQATAISPIPQAGARATVVLTILPGTTVSRGRCENGTDGFPFTVEIAETSGVGLTLDDTIVVEERRAGQVVSTRHLDNPLTTLRAGEKRRHSACGPRPGTYQAFFSGRDANGNTIRFASPIVTFAP